MQPPARKLLDQVRDAIRLKHYSYRTEQTYVQWIRRFILFHNKRHPQEMGVTEIEAFLTFYLHACLESGWQRRQESTRLLNDQQTLKTAHQLLCRDRFRFMIPKLV